jgi:formylglycine-generating enzyme required for sulfatase activity
MAIAPKSIYTGVALGLLVGGGYIGYDMMRSQDAVAEREARAAASASAAASLAAKAMPPPPAATTSGARPAASGTPAGPTTREGMVRIEGGTFQPTYLSKPVEQKPFFLDITEVTQKAYLACVEANACGPNSWAKSGAKLEGPAERLPANDVSWEDARAYCAWVKKRLPTEAEWELAARGTEGRKYPWGQDAPLDQLCWRNGQGPCEVGFFPRGDTPSGLKDMAGNVWEWTAEVQHCSSPEKPDTCDPHRHTARGGAWNTFSPQLVETNYRNALTVATNYVGMRCAAD